MELHNLLQAVFRDVLDDQQLVLTDETTAKDIPRWDSLGHINLMFSIEQSFGVRFKGNELADMRNIGELKRYLSANARS